MSREITDTQEPEIEVEEQYDFHCITCSDEALPVRVLSVNEASALARVEVGSVEEEVDISLVDTVAPGDIVLVHGGVALSVVDEGDDVAGEANR